MSYEEVRTISTEELEDLPSQITEYYHAYFSELRGLLEEPELLSEAVPEFLRGYKRIVAVLGSDGVAVAHFPIELDIIMHEEDGTVLDQFPSDLDASQDLFHFIAFVRSPVSDIVTLLSGGEDPDIEISPGVSWGVKGFAAPQQKVDPTTGELHWRAPWTRLVCADSLSLDYWKYVNRARREARIDLDHYLRAANPYAEAPLHEELDEIEAPEDIEEVDVRSGDRGVVVEVFEHPEPALLVEYADDEGQTKALVAYTTDLGLVLDVAPETDQAVAERLPVIVQR